MNIFPTSRVPSVTPRIEPFAMDSNGIIPIAPPPPGVTSNFVDPEDLSWQLRVAIGVTLPIAFIICLLRLYTSRFIVGRWHIDDGMAGS